MIREFNLSLHPEPFWLQEAFACMNHVPMLDSEDWLNKTKGQSRQQKEEFLLPYRNYRDAMRARLQPFFSQYPLLAGYVDPTPRDQESGKNNTPPIMLFLTEMQHVLEAEELPADEELETELNLAFQRALEGNFQNSSDVQTTSDTQTSSDGKTTEDDSELDIHSLSDVMTALEKWNGTDADKFKLLRLYSERQEAAKQLWHFQKSCKEIGPECMEAVQERYDACIKELEKPGRVETFLQKVGFQFEGKHNGQITPVIIPYNQVIVHMRSIKEKPGYFDLKLYIGIETFYLHRPEEEDSYKEEKLLAQLKALADPTRLKILHQLTKRPCYLQEMAKTLELTPATVLHHVGVLMTEQLIELQVTSEKKKIYYKIKEQGLKEASQGILQLAMTQKEQEALFAKQALQEHPAPKTIHRIIQK